jgi:hypothetical protein
MKRFCILLAVLLIPASYPLRAQPEAYNHPELEWYTIRTKHFQIHYHKGAERTAAEIARIAEKIYGPITDLYKVDDPGPFHFIVRDHDDYSNGVTYPYDEKIEIWASPMDFDLRGTHPWLWNVVTHEFTHLISLKKAKRFGSRIPGLFLQYMGYEKEKRPDVLYGFPNRIVSVPFAGMVIPHWFSEGIAQFQAPDEAYDFWDSHRDMILRMAVLNDRMLSYNDMCVFGHNSLGNEMVYNSGFSLVNYIAKFYGYSNLLMLVRAMDTPFRQSFSGAVRAVLGKSDRQLYKEWKSFLKETYLEGTREIRPHLVEGRLIEKKGFGNFYPVWSPNGRYVAYLSNQGEDYLGRYVLILYDTKKQKKKTLRSGVTGSIDFSPDGKEIVYAKRVRANRYGSKYLDLYIYNIPRKKEKRLTKGARARNPAWSPDGRKIACIIQYDGTDNIALVDLKKRRVDYLTQFSSGEQIFHLDWSPDGRYLVFDISVARHGRDLALFDIKRKKWRYLLRNAGDTRHPVFGSSSRTIYFSWDKTGIFNIYRMNLKTQKAVPLTTVLGGAFMPHYHKKGGLVFSLYTEDGYKISVLNKPAPQPERQYRARIHLPRTEAVANIPDPKSGNNGSGKGAVPYRQVYGPVNFLPRLLIDYGTVKLGTYVYSSEILNKYSFVAGFAMNRQWDMDIYALVEYRQFYPTFFLEIYDQVRHTEVGEDKFRYNLMEVDVGAQIQWNDANRFRIMYVLSRYAGRITTKVSGQEIKFGYTYLIGSRGSLEWTHTAVRPSVHRDISPDGGRQIFLRYDYQYNKFLDGFTVNSTYGTIQEVYKPYRYHQVSLDWREYLGLPWRHTLTWHAQAGYIDRKIDSFFNFFAGGLVGLKGYPFYSIEGRKLLNLSLIYRFPLWKDIGFQFGPFHLDKLYAGLYYQAGDAWNEGNLQWKKMKKDAGVQLRMDLFMFYSFPVRMFFDAAYGFNTFMNRGQIYGKEWRFYFGFAFGYLD